MKPPLAALALLSTAAFFPSLGGWIGAKILSVAGSATQTRISAASSHIGLGAATFSGVRITNLRGEPIAEIPSLQVRYSLRGLFPGSSHLYGLESVSLQHPRITIIRNRDGSYNLPSLKRGGAKKVGGAPFNLTASVQNGTIVVTDATRVHANARRITIADLNATAAIDTATSSRYHVALRYIAGAKRFPIAGFGTIDTAQHTSYQHWSAARLPIAQLVDFGANTRAVDATAGEVDGLDVRLFGLPGPHGTEHNRLLASAVLRGGNVRVAALAQPIRNLHGALRADEGGLTTPGIAGTVGPVPLRIFGGITGLKSPALDLVARGTLSLRDLRSVVPAAARVPLQGDIRYALRIGGTAKAPVALVALDARRGNALLAYDNGALDLFDAHLQTGNATMTAGARMQVRPNLRIAALFSLRSGSRTAFSGAAVVTRNGTAWDVAARANGAGGALAASGSYGPSGVQAAIFASNLDLTQLGLNVPVEHGFVSLATTVGGTTSAPRAQGTVLLRRALYRAYPIDGESAFRYADGRLALRDTVLGIGPAIAEIRGTVGGLALHGGFTPSYDLTAGVRAAQVAALVAMVNPQIVRREALAATLDANAHVGGSGRTPQIAAQIAVPEGSINGLGFDDLHATVDASTDAYLLRGGSVTVGSTHALFAGALQRREIRASLSIPHANLADFDDYFNTADTLAGRGRIAARVTSRPSQLRTTGTFALHDLRYRRFAIGKADAHWHTAGGRVVAAASFGGPHGTLVAEGSAALSNRALAVRARARNVDLGAWLPMAGMTAPISGRADADATISGRYPSLAIDANADLHNGRAYRVPIDSASIALRARNGRGRITRAVLRIPYLAASGNGTFGLHARDPFDLAIHAVSPNIGALEQTVTGKKNALAGSLDTTVRLRGTRANPAIADGFRLTDLQYGRLHVPSVTASVSATRRLVRLDEARVAFADGSIRAFGRLPIRLSPPGLAPPSAHLALTIAADRLNLADFADALPAGSHLAGVLSGTIAAGGTVASPAFTGTMTLANGAFSAPIERTPIDRIDATLALTATQIALRSLSARAGSGTIAASGVLRVPSLRDARAATGRLAIRMDGAEFDSPSYFKGTVDANVTIARAAGAIPSIAGTVDVPTARIPVTAFYNPHAPVGPKRVLPDIALDLRASAGNDVRVQSSAVDVGAAGSVTIGGTLPNPTLSGVVRSTGGTVNFLRNFQIARAVMHFMPANGIMPEVRARATTYVAQSDTSVAIGVSGLAPNELHITFSSNPSYDRSQILGILAGVQTPGVPSVGTVSNPTATNELTQLAVGQLDTVFTRNLFEPLSAQVGSALGLTNFSVNDTLNGGFGLNAAKAFGRNLTASFSESLAPPMRESLSLEAHAARSAGVRLTIYSQAQPPLTGYQPTAAGLALDTIGSTVMLQPFTGTSGFNLSYLHEWL